MSIGQKLYNYECESCDFEKGVTEFLIEEFREDIIFGAVASMDENTMPKLICTICGCKFKHKKTDNR